MTAGASEMGHFGKHDSKHWAQTREAETDKKCGVQNTRENCWNQSFEKPNQLELFSISWVYATRAAITA
jgi:hypothetical protein